MNYSQQEVNKKKRALTGNSKKTMRRIRKYLGYASAIIGIALIFVCVLGTSKVIRGLVSHTPKVQELDLLSKGSSSVMYDIAGKEIQKLDASDIDSEYVGIADIPQGVQQAFVAAEDRYFYEHHGVDMQGIFQVIYQELTGNSLDSSATDTITLQLIKNQIMSGEKGNSLMKRVSNRITEQLLGVDLENSLDKEQILEYYLNTINMGEGLTGVQAASKRYFDKDIMELTVSEAAVLAAVVADPAQYDPVSHQEENTGRRSQILKIMLEDGLISEDEYEDALGDAVYLRVQNAVNAKINVSDKFNSYYTDAVANQVILDLKNKLGYSQTQAYNALYRSGLKIYTCQDNAMQSICDSVVNDDRYYPADKKSYLTYSLVIAKDGVLKEYSEIDVKNYIFESRNENISLFFVDNKKARYYVSMFKKYMLKEGGVLVSENFQLVKRPQTSFVLMEQATGRVKAVVGGRGQRLVNRAINRATEDTRQPGTALDVMSVYLPALDTAGMTLGTLENNGEHGLMTIRNAILSSDPFSSVNTLKKTSVRTGYEYLRKLGFSTIVEKKEDEAGNINSDLQLQLAEGKLVDGVTNLELTAAYAAIANRGIYQRPRFYTKIVDGKGNILLENDTSATRVMKESTAWLLTNVMKEGIEKGAAQKAGFSDLMIEQAGETGTTDGMTDFWFDGYTPYYTAGIWTGQDEENGNAGENTAYHLTIWKEIMERIHKQKNLQSGKFHRPEDIVSYNICTECGNLAIEGLCTDVQGKSYVQKEYFAAGTEPKQNCNCHVKYKICRASGMLAGKNCPKEDTYEEVFLIEPADVQGVSGHLKTNQMLQEQCKVHNSTE